MYIVPLAWLYVALMMAVAEATNSNGTLLGAIITFVLYGLTPVLLVVYLMASPARRKALRAKEAAEFAAANASANESANGSASESANEASAEPADLSTQPDAGGHAPAAAPGDGITPVREKP
jgi:predicted lipid-binding transport protein (Tim44 family)